VLDGVPIGSAVISIQLEEYIPLEEYISLMENQGYSFDELCHLSAKKIQQLSE
jgi:hypothetical protein